MTPTDHVIRRRESDENCSQRDPNGGWEGSYAASVVQRKAAPATAAPGVFTNGATALVIHTPITLIRRDVRLSLAAYRPCQPQTRPAAIGQVQPKCGQSQMRQISSLSPIFERLQSGHSRTSALHSHHRAPNCKSTPATATFRLRNEATQIALF